MILCEITFRQIDCKACEVLRILQLSQKLYLLVLKESFFFQL